MTYFTAKSDSIIETGLSARNLRAAKMEASRVFSAHRKIILLEYEVEGEHPVAVYEKLDSRWKRLTD